MPVGGGGGGVGEGERREQGRGGVVEGAGKGVEREGGGWKSEGDRVDPRGKAGCHVHEKQHGADVF